MKISYSTHNKTIDLVIASLFVAFSIALLSLSSSSAVNAQSTLADDQPVPVDSSYADDSTGYIVSVNVKSEDGSAKVGVPVEFGKFSAKTDKNGVAGFIDVPAGEHTIKSESEESKVTVKTGDKATVQKFDLIIYTGLSNDEGLMGSRQLSYTALFVSVGVVGLILIGIYTRNRKNKSTIES